jgi:prepilin-type N-terminal cleavage/methylation domain-containing protein
MERIRRGFTLLELIFSIVILSIMALVGTDIIAHIYDEYRRVRDVNVMQARLTNAVNVISKRMAFRIRESTIARNAAGYVYIDNKTSNHNVVEWIGSDYEGMLGDWNGSWHVGWSGFTDIDANETNATHLKSPGSDFSKASALIMANSNGTVDLNNTMDTAIIFKRPDYDFLNGYGWGTDNNHTQIHPVQRVSNDLLVYDINSSPSTAQEHYTMVWSAYALEHDRTNDELIFYYNYQPWQSATYTDGDSALLITNVTSFDMEAKSGIISMRLCIDRNSTVNNFELCKDRIIY